MKVLFAVSSEEISEKIIRRYQKEYKEILSYKNVYYFNAILKEIQKDKTYDRIVISEDLEPFANNNYDTIDKLIFDRLDSISDEAHDMQGKETAIILICTERRTKGSSILLKLFGIGIYNALLGNDRSMEQVCKLINRPRGKKEAKQYYQIDTEEVNYKAENENEVSEIEIQNILAHFKKLGRNTERYSESFKSIASQYNDEQLKIVVNCLPMNVKAVLEATSPKYQELMSVSGNIRPEDAASVEKKVRNAGLRIDNISSAEKNQMNGPIVIPSNVRTNKNARSVVTNQENRTIPKPIVPTMNVRNNETVQQENRSMEQSSIQQAPKQVVRPRVVQPTMRRPAEPVRPVQNTYEQTVTKNVQNQTNLQDNTQDIDSILPGIEDMQEKEEIQEKKGRGRPRKIVTEITEEKPKGKRGRPRKVIEDQEDILPVVEDESSILPGLEDDSLSMIDDSILPGTQNVNTQEDDISSLLPGFEDVEEQDDVSDLLPGLEDDTKETNLQNNTVQKQVSPVKVSNVQKNTIKQPEKAKIQPIGANDDISSLLPETNFDDEEEYTDEVMLPGLDELDDIDDVQDDSNLGNNENIISNTNNTVDETTEYEDFDDGLLPGLDGFEEDEETDETLLPGMGFEDEEPVVSQPVQQQQVQNNVPRRPLHSYTVRSGGLRQKNILPSKNADANINNDSKFESDFEPSYNDVHTENVNNQNTYTPNNYVQEETNNYNNEYSNNYGNNYGSVDSLKPKVDYSMSSLNSLLTQDKKIVTFIGTTKNGTSFLVNNIAAIFSSLGINTAILDMTKNRNSYYIYTKNEEELRKIAYNSMEKLEQGYAEGIKVDKNLTVYTALPNDGKVYTNAEAILSTLVQNHSVVLIDCDFDTDPAYFASCQEIYLVQSLDILTIQPLTAFLRDLKTKGVLEPEKVRVVINKDMKVGNLTNKVIIAGMSFYNDPAMSFMTELFNKDMVKYCVIPFDEKAYSKYLEAMVECKVSYSSYPSNFINKLKTLGDMVYPLTSKQAYGKQTNNTAKANNNFSNSMNSTLNKMRKKY